MPLDAGAIQRADQIAHRFFTKFALVVDNARNVASEPREEAKTDKWVSVSVQFVPCLIGTPDSRWYGLSGWIRTHFAWYERLCCWRMLHVEVDFVV